MNAAAPKPELIDDRAISSSDEDELLHEGFAEELADLLRAVQPPANVALFGSWGAGKSGLGRLLCRILDKKQGVRCVIFDAFKYAELPLRRQFISNVADGLGIHDDEFHAGMYRDVSHTDFKLPLSKTSKVLGLFAAAGLVAMAVFFGLAAIVAGVLDGSFRKNFELTLKSGPLLLMTPAALLAAFVALANKWIPLEHKRSRPDSEEEFEERFVRLVKKSGAKRLIVFIDELDRCTPREVVETLETIRTFLEIKPCVFVVAADQAVLERALSESLGQATPVDRANPYYSAGSEYLDKVFGYQLSVPPLMPRRLSGFALNLLDKRQGIWQDVDHDRVVSALIPVHVRSPRRVKTLLNAYVSTYRMARRRHDEGVLRAPPSERADEIAKLVCLRHEFPLFAAELVTDAQMPGYVLTIAGLIRNGDNWQNERPAQVRDELWRRAGAYAEGKLPVDVYLADAGDSSDEDDPDAEDLKQAQCRHGLQLVNYLQATRRIEGPSRDLVHLETGGEVYGLSPAFADELELMAVNRATAATADRVEGLESQAEQLAALRLLARRASEAETSGERENVLTAMAVAVAALADQPETGAAADRDEADD